jgi:hypothetical protein
MENEITAEFPSPSYRAGGFEKTSSRGGRVSWDRRAHRRWVERAKARCLDQSFTLRRLKQPMSGRGGRSKVQDTASGERRERYPPVWSYAQRHRRRRCEE